jgi:F-type H+-transporting ATPase subunit delta
MSRRADAIQYAKGLFAVAVSDADPRKVGEELDAFQALLDQAPELRRVMVNAAIPPARKLAVLAELERLSPVSPVLRQFLVLLAKNDAFTLLPRVAADYGARLLLHLRIVSAEVTTAVPLPAEREAALAQRIADATGKQVRVSTAVDPALIGGAVTRIGSVVYDGSVRRQLDRLREQFIERA